MAAAQPRRGWRFAQRSGESTDSFSYKEFICTSRRDELDALSSDFPKRWHVEEFFNLYQDLGWKKAGTLNLNIRYGRTTMALNPLAVRPQTRFPLQAALGLINCHKKIAAAVAGPLGLNTLNRDFNKGGDCGTSRSQLLHTDLAVENFVFSDSFSFRKSVHSECHNVLCTRTFLALAYLKLYLLPLIKSCTLDFGMMDEQIFPAIVWRDESESFV